MGRRDEDGQVEQAGLAIAAGLLALVSPWAAALVLGVVGVWLAAQAQVTPARTACGQRSLCRCTQGVLATPRLRTPVEGLGAGPHGLRAHSVGQPPEI